LILPAATALLLLAAAQSNAAGGRDAGGVDVPAEEARPPEEPQKPTVTDDFTGPSGVPFMPSVGAVTARQGTFLDVALLSQLRARTLAGSDGSTVWGTDVEVTPGVAIEVGSPTISLSLGYAPRLTVPFNVGSFELAVLNRATLRAEWRASDLWTVTGLGIFVVGDFSQLVPASTPGGAGPAPPVLNPVRSFQTYPYVGIDTLLRVDGILSPRTRLRVAGGYFDVGGTGDVGQANQPRTWGPQAEGALSWLASRTATLLTTATVRDWMMVGDFDVLVGTVTEGWKQSWSPDLDSTVALGAGLANRDVESWTAAGHLMPVASLQLDYHPVSQEALRLALDAALAPYVDVYLRIPYQRFTVGVRLDWSPSDAWRLQASLLAALAPHSVLAPESYGTGGLSASYAPVKFLILSLGGFTQVQFQGESTGNGAFRQWTTYFSLALRDTFAL